MKFTFLVSIDKLVTILSTLLLCGIAFLVILLLTTSTMLNFRESDNNRVIRCDSSDCNLKNCYLCTNGMSKELYLKFHEKGWYVIVDVILILRPKRIVPVFVYLEKSNNREWQHLTHDIIPYIATHWNAFWPNGTAGINGSTNIVNVKEKPTDKSWKECIKALISRKKNLFESGKSTHGTRGNY